MKTKVKKGDRQVELSFELKYCERCGGLWLRPAGGGQIYCVGCARQMVELPTPSDERKNSRAYQGGRGNGADRPINDENYGSDEESAGGVA